MFLPQCFTGSRARVMSSFQRPEAMHLLSTLSDLDLSDLLAVTGESSSPSCGRVTASLLLLLPNAG